MQVRELMSDHVICCTPDTNLQDVAKLMAEHDCGDIPVIQDRDGRRLIGVITDRDITCRAVAEGPKSSRAHRPGLHVEAGGDRDARYDARGLLSHDGAQPNQTRAGC